MKKILKLTIILCLIFLLFEQISYVYAESRVVTTDGTAGSAGGEPYVPETYDRKDEGWDGIFSDANDFLKNGRTNPDKSFKFNIADFKISIDGIFNVLVALGTVLTVIIGGILGVKFMAASAEDKAKIKESIIPYAMGCAIIYGAYIIWKLIVSVLGGI